MSYIQPWTPQKRRMIVNHSVLTLRHAAEGYPHDDKLVAKEHLRWNATLCQAESDLAKMTAERDVLATELAEVKADRDSWEHCARHS